MTAHLGLVLLLGLSACVPRASSHGTLIDPPSTASMWRFGFPTPEDYDDNGVNCGGAGVQWDKNDGKCGICGDAWNDPQPRAHETGGKYGMGIVVRTYKMAATIPIGVNVTASHKGYFEFRLCKHDKPKEVVRQECLDKTVLRKAKSEDGEKDHPTRYYIGSESKVYKMSYVLPKGLTCPQCVLQWTWVTDNGSREWFRACADVAIGGTDPKVTTTTTSTTTEAPEEMTTEPEEINEVATKKTIKKKLKTKGKN